MKVLATGYTFNAVAKTVTFSGSIPPSLESILSITNYTTGTLLFQPQAGAARGGTWASPVLTLACSTTGMANTDRLLILFEDGQAQPFSAASLPLPNGASTSALQTTGNTSLGSIDGKLPALDGARVPVVDSSTRGAGAVDAATLRVTEASDSPLVAGLGAQADAAASSDTGTFSLFALVKRSLLNWTTLLGRVPALTVTSTRLLVDGSGVTQPVSATSLPLPAGAATEAKQPAPGTAGTPSADVISVQGVASGTAVPISATSLPLPAGASTSALQTTGNTSLSSIDTKTPALQSGAVPVGDNGGSLTVDGRSGTTQVVFTRPADTTPYALADVIGSATTANHEALSAGVSGSLLMIQSASVCINATSVPSGLTTLRIHVWDSAPTAIADNAAFAAAAADRTKYCGYIDLSAVQVIGGGFLWSFGDYIGRPVRLSGTSFFFNLALSGAAGFTPASATEFRVRFHNVEAGT